MCLKENKVLCGVNEPCSRTGCSYDHHYQWTGEECQADDVFVFPECGVRVVRGIKGVAPYCEKNPDALVRDDGSGMGIAFACCDADGSSGCTRTVSGSCDAGHWTRSPPWAPMKWSDAMDYCAKYGKTLCGSSDSARCQGSGCYLAHDFNCGNVWPGGGLWPRAAGMCCCAKPGSLSKPIRLRACGMANRV